MSFTTLNASSIEGLYVDRLEGGLIWIVEAPVYRVQTGPRVKIAIALNAFRDLPAFAFFVLDNDTMARGALIGTPTIKVDSVSPKRRLPNRVGVLQIYRSDVILKANDPCGDVRSLIIKPGAYEYSNDSVFVDNWSLTVAEVGNFPIYSTTGRQLARRYPDALQSDGG